MILTMAACYMAAYYKFTLDRSLFSSAVSKQDKLGCRP